MAKPTELPTWATGAGAAKTDPGAAKKALGWIKEKVPHQWLNYWMNLVYTWFEWLEFAPAGIDTLQEAASYLSIGEVGVVREHDPADALARAVLHVETTAPTHVRTCCDGEYVYVAISNAGPAATVYALNRTTGAVVWSNSAVAVAGTYIYAICADGNAVYVGGGPTAATGADRIKKLNRTTGAVEASLSTSIGRIYDLYSSGAHLYAVGEFAGLSKNFYDLPLDLSSVTTADLASLGDDCNSIDGNGHLLYVAHNYGAVQGNVQVLDITTPASPGLISGSNPTSWTEDASVCVAVEDGVVVGGPANSGTNRAVSKLLGEGLRTDWLMDPHDTTSVAEGTCLGLAFDGRWVYATFSGDGTPAQIAAGPPVQALRAGRVRCLDPRTGEVVWTLPSAELTQTPFHHSLAADATGLFIGHAQDGSNYVVSRIGTLTPSQLVQRMDPTDAYRPRPHLVLPIGGVR